MAAFDYTRVRATAEKLIARFGMVGTVIRDVKSGTDYDPTIIQTSYPCKLVVLDYEDSKIDGSLIRRTDKMVYLSTEGLTITPTDADRVSAGDEYSIVSIKPLSPAGDAIFYEIQART